MVRSHGEVAHKVVDASHLDGKSYTKRHGEHHEQSVDGSGETHLMESREHIADEIDERHSRHNEQRTSQERMPRCGGVEECRQSECSRGVG